MVRIALSYCDGTDAASLRGRAVAWADTLAVAAGFDNDSMMTSDRPFRNRPSRRAGGGPTSNDVARHAGVSPMTVSRVINGEANVRPATRETVNTAIAALNYA